MLGCTFYFLLSISPTPISPPLRWSQPSVNPPLCSPRPSVGCTLWYLPLHWPHPSITSPPMALSLKIHPSIGPTPYLPQLLAPPFNITHILLHPSISSSDDSTPFLYRCLYGVQGWIRGANIPQLFPAPPLTLASRLFRTMLSNTFIKSDISKSRHVANSICAY